MRSLLLLAEKSSLRSGTSSVSSADSFPVRGEAGVPFRKPRSFLIPFDSFKQYTGSQKEGSEHSQKSECSDLSLMRSRGRVHVSVPGRGQDIMNTGVTHFHLKVSRP